MSQNRVIHFYRRGPNDKKIRYRLELDSENVVVSEGVAPQNLISRQFTAQAVDPRNITASDAAYLQHLRSRGIEFVVTPENGVTITKVPALEAHIAKFFVFKPFNETETPCWFEGCQELRAQFLEFFKASSPEGVCSDCDKGQLMAQFRPRIEPAIVAHLNGVTT